MSAACPAYFATPLDQALFAAAETLIQPPSGEPLPPLANGRFRYVLACNGLFVQTRTAALEASLPLAVLPAGLPYGSARSGVHLRCAPPPPSLWRELKRRAVAACPGEWTAYLLHDGANYQVFEPPIRSRDAGHITYQPLPAALQAHLVLHVHSHGFGEAAFSVQDDAADATGGDGVYFAVVFGRCETQETVTEVWRLIVWRWSWPFSASHPFDQVMSLAQSDADAMLSVSMTAETAHGLTDS